jgi:hypothetical protein
MSCITCVAQEVAMATTQLMRAPSYRICWPLQEKVLVETRSPRMNWVVVTDEDQNRRMQMQWQPSAGDR